MSAIWIASSEDQIHVSEQDKGDGVFWIEQRVDKARSGNT